MAFHALYKIPEPDALAKAKIQLAAALRLAVFHELDEGIDNHFTVSVPGRQGQYLILPLRPLVGGALERPPCRLRLECRIRCPGESNERHA